MQPSKNKCQALRAVLAFGGCLYIVNNFINVISPELQVPLCFTRKQSALALS